MGGVCYDKLVATDLALIHSLPKFIVVIPVFMSAIRADGIWLTISVE